MKKCHNCKLEKALTEFNKNKAKRDGLASTCRECMKVLRKAHYEANKPSYIADVIARKKVNKEKTVEKLLGFLQENPCVDCGNTDPRVLEFDHREASEKAANVSQMVCEGYGWGRISEEIAKCDVRCANCHRIRTQLQFGSFRSLWI